MKNVQEYNPIIENLIMITEIYAEVMTNGKNEELRKQIDAWKDENDIPFTRMGEILLDWANEFEERFGEGRTDDYIGAIESFTIYQLRNLKPESKLELDSDYKIGDVVTVSLASLYEAMSEKKRTQVREAGQWYTDKGMRVEIEVEVEGAREEDGEIIEKTYFDLVDEDFCDGESAIVTGVGPDRYALFALDGEREWKKEMSFSESEMKIAAMRLRSE